MIEIVFDDSAGGMMKQAQNYGRGPFNEEGCPAMFFFDDTGKMSEDELRAAAKAHWEGQREERRRAWESAIPLGGKPADVYDLALDLSMGDITGEPSGQRHRDMTNRAMERLAAGDSVRIWYSHNADEYCGLLWFCWKMREAGVPMDKVQAVKLPEWYYAEDSGTMLKWKDWGEVHTQYAGHLAKSARHLPEIFIRGCADAWEKLRQENAPLRAVVSGRVISVPEDFYDHLLYKAVDKLHAEKGEFTAGRLVAAVYHYQLGIPDSWQICRIKKMIEDGKLEVVKEDPEGFFYAHKLRKV